MVNQDWGLLHKMVCSLTAMGQSIYCLFWSACFWLRLLMLSLHVRSFFSLAFLSAGAQNDSGCITLSFGSAEGYAPSVVPPTYGALLEEWRRAWVSNPHTLCQQRDHRLGVECFTGSASPPLFQPQRTSLIFNLTLPQLGVNSYIRICPCVHGLACVLVGGRHYLVSIYQTLKNAVNRGEWVLMLMDWVNLIHKQSLTHIGGRHELKLRFFKNCADCIGQPNIGFHGFCGNVGIINLQINVGQSRQAHNTLTQPRYLIVDRFESVLQSFPLTYKLAERSGFAIQEFPIRLFISHSKESLSYA